MVDNIVVCVQRRTQVFDAMKILTNVPFFHSFVAMVEREFFGDYQNDLLVCSVDV